MVTVTTVGYGDKVGGMLGGGGECLARGCLLACWLVQPWEALGGHGEERSSNRSWAYTVAVMVRKGLLAAGALASGGD